MKRFQTAQRKTFPLQNVEAILAEMEQEQVFKPPRKAEAQKMNAGKEAGNGKARHQA